jgi:hypothetical protein
MASSWQRPTLRVSTTSPRDSSDGGAKDALSPSSPYYRQASFADRLKVQEERRQKLDELQSARQKAEDDKEEAELEKQGIWSDGKVAAEAQQLAKAQLDAERKKGSSSSNNNNNSGNSSSAQAAPFDEGREARQPFGMVERGSSSSSNDQGGGDGGGGRERAEGVGSDRPATPEMPPPSDSEDDDGSFSYEETPSPLS